MDSDRRDFLSQKPDDIGDFLGGTLMPISWVGKGLRADTWGEDGLYSYTSDMNLVKELSMQWPATVLMSPSGRRLVASNRGLLSLIQEGPEALGAAPLGKEGAEGLVFRTVLAVESDCVDFVLKYTFPVRMASFCGDEGFFFTPGTDQMQVLHYLDTHRVAGFGVNFVTPWVATKFITLAPWVGDSLTGEELQRYMRWRWEMDELDIVFGRIGKTDLSAAAKDVLCEMVKRNSEDGAAFVKTQAVFDRFDELREKLQELTRDAVDSGRLKVEIPKHVVSELEGGSVDNWLVSVPRLYKSICENVELQDGGVDDAFYVVEAIGGVWDAL